MLPLPWLLTTAACTLGFTPISDRSGDDDTDAAETDLTAETDTDTQESGDTSTADSDTEDTVLPAGSDPMIVEVCDGNDGPWKFVELYNPADTAKSLAGWTLQVFTNGASSATYTVDLKAITIAARSTWVIATTQNGGQAAFKSRFDGQDAQTWSEDIVGNGDDAYVLAEGPDRRDAYGVPGQDGSGTAWFYGDTCAKRQTSVTAASAVWSISQWVVDVSPKPFARD